MMPAFAQLGESEKQALAAFILDHHAQQKEKFIAPPKPWDPWTSLPYSATGYIKFLTKEGFPAVSPPWGTLSAIDLNTGEYLWRDTLGDYAELKPRHPLGTELWRSRCDCRRIAVYCG
jgi:quinoprotein glucose dehydrogenase